MRSIARFVVGALVAIPLTVAGAGLATADDYQSNNTTAGPNGTSSVRVISGVDDEGNAFFYHQRIMTGPNGASSEVTSSSTGSGLPGDEGAGSSFNHSMNSAGPDGASSSGVSANAG